MAQNKTLVSRIQNYRRYDKKRWGANDTSITYDEFIELLQEQGGVCFWTGLPMTVSQGLPTDMSLDRLDNSKPHTKENCVIVQQFFNLGRNDTTAYDHMRYLAFTLHILADHWELFEKKGLI